MVPECRHIKTSGGKCGSPALRGEPFCYFHDRLRKRAARQASPFLALELPALEDRGAIQIAIGEVVHALADHRIDPKRAGMLLYALQIASSNAKHSEEIICSDSIEEITHTEQGDELAPEGSISGPPGEPSLYSLLSNEIERRKEEKKELGSDRATQLLPNEDFDEEGEGDGDTPGWIRPY